MIASAVIFSLLALVASVAALNRFINVRKQPSFAFSLVEVIAIYIPISIAFLLPTDIFSSNDDGTGSKQFLYMSPKNILLLWKLDYWSAFVLMWAFLPFVQEYYRSGEFTPVAKMKDSIRNNLKFQLIVGSIGAVGLTYFFFRFGFTLQTFKDLLIALSHSYSLVLSLWLMSHGLVTIPRRRWVNNISLDHQLESLYFELPKLYEELNESTYNYKDICSIIKSLSVIPGIDQSVFAVEVMELNKTIPTDDQLDLRNHIRTTQYTSIEQLSHSTLAKLHRNLKSETTNYKSALYEFNKAKREILRCEDIVDSKVSRSLKFRYGNNFIKNGKLSFLTHVYIIPALNLLIALLSFALSFVVIESELLHSTKLSIINIFMSTGKINATAKFIISFIVLSYMVLCSLISLTRIKLFKMYHLFPNDSNPVSVVFFTMYSNRLTIPLSYNFLTLLQSSKVHSQFDTFLGKSINLSVLGGFFNTTLPRLIIIPILFASFNVFDRIKKKLSFDYFDAFDSDDEAESANDAGKRASKIREGKSIIQRETGPARGATHGRLTSTVRASDDDLPDAPLLYEEDEGSSSWGISGLTKWFKRGGQGDTGLQIV